MNGYVYIIQSLRNDRYYIGSTNDLGRRLVEHSRGKSKYTAESGPWKLVFSQEFEKLTVARTVELWLKKQKDTDFVRRVIIEGKIVKEFG